MIRLVRPFELTIICMRKMLILLPNALCQKLLQTAIKRAIAIEEYKLRVEKYENNGNGKRNRTPSAAHRNRKY